MSKPRFDWWNNVVYMVRNYPTRKAEYEAIHNQRITANLSGVPGAKNQTRITEITALKQLPRAKQQEYDAVTEAIRITKTHINGGDHIELIKRMYWQGKKLTLAEATPSLYISEATGKRWHADFIRLVGVCFGYVDIEV